jgi:hypothetical protein
VVVDAAQHCDIRDASGLDDERAVSGDDELHVREQAIEVRCNFALPPRVQVQVDLVDQGDRGFA